jgi:hypothetical protein
MRHKFARQTGLDCLTFGVSARFFVVKRQFGRSVEVG